MRQQDLKPIKAALQSLLTQTHGEHLPLTKFLQQAGAIHPEISDAISGIYCSYTGTDRSPVFGEHLLVFGWHTNDITLEPPYIEFAYIS